MKPKKLLSYTFLCLIITGILAYGLIRYNDLTSFEDEKERTQPIKVILKIDFAGLRPQVSQTIVSNTSISALSILELGGHNVSVKWYGELAYVQAIDGVWENTAIKGYYWIYYVNGQWGNKASNLFYLDSNMTVEWKYEMPNSL